jgi:hypothetical protein
MPEFVQTADFTNLPVANFALQNFAPAAPVSGSKFFDPTNGHEYVFTGTGGLSGQGVWVATGQIANVGPVSSTTNSDGTFTVTIAAATPSASGLMSASDKTKLDDATATGTAGKIVLWNASNGLTANVTGNLAGTANNANNLNGQPGSYYLDLANSTGTLPTSAGGLGIDVSSAGNGQILIGNGSGLSLNVISAGPGISILSGPGTITIAANISGTVAPADASYVVIGTHPTLTSERVLTAANSQLTLTDGGANSAVTLGLSAVAVAGEQQPKVTIDEFGRVLSSTALTSADIPTIPKSKIGDFVESDYVHTTGNETIGGNKTFSNAVTINGDLFVSGSTTTVSSQSLIVSDNMVVINSGEPGVGVTNVSAGLQVDRGPSANPYIFAFFEDSDTFRIGEPGSFQAVATRADTIANNSLVKWDDVNKILVDTGINAGTILTSASSLNGANLILGSVANDKLTNSSITVDAGAGLAGGGSVALGSSVTVSLSPTGTAGTYTKVTTNIYGQVVSGTTLTSGDIPAHTQAWSTITNTPTTLAGYGITDAVNTTGDQTINGVKNFALTPTVSGSYVVYHTGNFVNTGGTVTSVALTAPTEISVAGSPVISSGTIALTWATQASGAVFAGPTAGAATTPAFRNLVATDIPALDFSKITTGIVPVAQGGTGAGSASGARISLSIATIAAATIVGDDVNDTFVITNVFNNADVVVQVTRSAGAVLGNVVIPTINIGQSSPYAITVSFGKKVPTGTSYRVQMVGVGA